MRNEIVANKKIFKRSVKGCGSLTNFSSAGKIQFLLYVYLQIYIHNSKSNKNITFEISIVSCGNNTYTQVFYSQEIALPLGNLNSIFSLYITRVLFMAMWRRLQSTASALPRPQNKDLPQELNCLFFVSNFGI